MPFKKCMLWESRGLVYHGRELTIAHDEVDER